MSKRIFIIEDDANILCGLQAKFSSDGYAVFTSAGVENMEELLSKIKTANTEYVILDILLPKMDGFEVLHEIKADHDIAKLPVFVFTSLSDTDTKKKCETLGAAHVFIKGELMLDDFVVKVKKIIDNREKVLL